MNPLYEIAVTCPAGCDNDEVFDILDAGAGAPCNIDDVLRQAKINLTLWDNTQGLPLVGTVQNAIARLIGVMPQLEGVMPEDQSAMTYVTIGVLVLIRDAILAHSYGPCTVTVKPIKSRLIAP